MIKHKLMHKVINLVLLSVLHMHVLNFQVELCVAAAKHSVQQLLFVLQ